MQFSTLLTLAGLSLAVLAAPAPQLEDSRKPSCYDACLASRICVASYPEGCYCMNRNRIACAEECKLTSKPKLDDCDLLEPTKPVPTKPVPTPTTRPTKPGKECFDKCVQGWACPLAYPQSCYCQNGIWSRCSEQCNYPFKLAECPPYEGPIIVELKQ